MNPVRIIFVIFCAAALGGAAYVSASGVGGESRDLITSVRVGSGGAAGLHSQVK